jgi:hypothetical protein
MTQQENQIPRWIRELERLSTFKSQLYIHGNIKDTMLFPVGEDRKMWTLGPIREALFELYKNQIGKYDLIAAYNTIDGMVFAGKSGKTEDKKPEDLYTEVLNSAAKSSTQSKLIGNAPQALQPQDPIDHAINQMRLCLSNRNKSVLFIIENGSQLLTSPVNMPQSERSNFLRLLKASAESQQVASLESTNRKVTQNMLLILCDKLTDLPTWLYLGNPYSGSVEIETPYNYERKKFFDLFFTNDKVLGEKFDQKEMVDLSDGMTIRDLCGIRMLARKSDTNFTKAKSLIDCFKYGIAESEWDNLDWNRMDKAEEILSQRVIGQPAAVNAVADVLRRARLGLSGAQHSSNTKPRGILFFAGPTGVGKTELAKAISELVFRTDDACIRFDMSEYSQGHSDQRLLGAPPGYVGYEEGGQLTNQLKKNPFSVLLFDEIEKAHPTILDKFLQILEDGRMTDGRGDTVYFSESIIIFTSNVGMYQLDQNTGRPLVNPLTGQPKLQIDPSIDTEYESVKDKMTEGVSNYFKHVLGRPELLNRIGQNIVVFDFVRLPMLRKILEQKTLKSISTQIKDKWKVNVEFSPVVIDDVMEIVGTDISAGGRGMGNLAEKLILNPLARILFELIGKNTELTGKTMLISHLIAPETPEINRYELEWELI